MFQILQSCQPMLQIWKQQKKVNFNSQIPFTIWPSSNSSRWPLTATLISFSHLCDDDCMSLFTKHDIKLPNRTKLSSWEDMSRTAYGRYEYHQCLCNRQMAFSDSTRQKKSWLTITMHFLASPPNLHSSEQFVRDISQISQVWLLSSYPNIFLLS